jgi:ribokinase
MPILNLGSVNIDHVYEVEHFVRPGETLSSSGYQIFAGGKGFNQSVALARAGALIFHAGRIGQDAGWLVERLQKESVDTTHLHESDTPTGHAMIQVEPSGENSIVLYDGANQTITEADSHSACAAFSEGDYLLVQNETNLIAQAIQTAHDRKMRIVFNPAPMTSAVRNYPLNLVDLFVLNETEAEGLTGETNPDAIRQKMLTQYPNAAVVLTLGSKGAIYFDAQALHHESAPTVDAIDTTAAGDTFTGFFLAELMQSNDPTKALHQGCRAAAICVTRTGAADSIPYLKEL